MKFSKVSKAVLKPFKGLKKSKKVIISGPMAPKLIGSTWPILPSLPAVEVDVELDISDICPPSPEVIVSPPSNEELVEEPHAVRRVSRVVLAARPQQLSPLVAEETNRHLDVPDVHPDSVSSPPMSFRSLYSQATYSIPTPPAPSVQLVPIEHIEMLVWPYHQRDEQQRDLIASLRTLIDTLVEEKQDLVDQVNELSQLVLEYQGEHDEDWAPPRGRRLNFGDLENGSETTETPKPGSGLLSPASIHPSKPQGMSPTVSYSSSSPPVHRSVQRLRSSRKHRSPLSTSSQSSLGTPLDNGKGKEACGGESPPAYDPRDRCELSADRFLDSAMVDSLRSNSSARLRGSSMVSAASSSPGYDPRERCTFSADRFLDSSMHDARESSQSLSSQTEASSKHRSPVQTPARYRTRSRQWTPGTFAPSPVAYHDQGPSLLTERFPEPTGYDSDAASLFYTSPTPSERPDMSPRCEMNTIGFPCVSSPEIPGAPPVRRKPLLVRPRAPRP